MRLSTGIATSLVLGTVGLGVWVAFHHRPAPLRLPDSPSAEVQPAVRVDKTSEATLAPEPTPPGVGTPQARIYLEDLASGDERALAVVRQALSDGRASPRGADADYMQKLGALERIYVERVERHRHELALER